MAKLATILVVFLALVAPSSVVASNSAAEVKLGWCFSNADCTGEHLQVNAQPGKAVTPLTTTEYPYCKSYLHAPDPSVTAYACQNGCNGPCNIGQAGQCTYLSPGSAANARFECITRA